MVIYACLLLFNLGYMSFLWDEGPHLYGGLLLTRGQSQEYLATYGYYPPVYDLLTAVFFNVFGVSAVSGRLVAVMFSLLSLWIVFEFANRTYGPKIALAASILLGVMPGFFWVSRVTMLETILVFFFSLALFFFFSWLRFSQNKTLLLCGLALGVGFLAKYQVLVAGLVMIVAILVLCRKKLRLRFSKFLVLPLIAVLVVVPWFLVLYQTNGLTKFGDLLYVVQEGGQDRAEYSIRFPIPIFYLIEMTWPYNVFPHPISLPLYILGLAGLALFAYRRRTEDKFFLVWFIVVYVFFTLIPNRQWRYVIPLFPVLAISAASFIFFVYGKIGATWKKGQVNLSNRRVKQIAAALFIAFVTSAIFFSSYEAYYMTAQDQIHVPVEEVTRYAVSNMTQNESMVLLGPFNMFNQDMFRFYLPTNMSKDQVWQYPELPVESFTPNFNITEFIDLCEQRNVKWVIFYEHGPDAPFVDTTLTWRDIMIMLSDSGRFGKIADEPWQGFGTYPYRLFIFGFLHNQTR
jgi:4-amino-4-deoxy-L-arabinose transferase-like glycosyltransferase